MDPPGILMLHSIRKVFELAGIEPESIQFRKDEFDETSIIDALIKDPKKCPVITTADFTDYFKDGSRPYNMHVMVTAGALKGSEFLLPNNCVRVLCTTLERMLCNKQYYSILMNEWFIKCKNSYGNDPDQPGTIQYRINKIFMNTLMFTS